MESDQTERQGQVRERADERQVVRKERGLIWRQHLRKVRNQERDADDADQGCTEQREGELD